MSSTQARQPLFEVDTIARYLYSKNPHLSPLKLQKALYFLFAYHGALYAQEESEGAFEGTGETPRLLFDAVFEAWQYGPVIRDVWIKDKRGEYTRDRHLTDVAIADVSERPEVQLFIDELVEQINSISDFQLVDRSHEDRVWKEAFRRGQSTVMDKDAIIEEYVERYVAE